MAGAAEAVPVSPASSTTLPALESDPEVNREGSAGAVGKARTCKQGRRSGRETDVYLPLAAQRDRDPGSRIQKVQAQLRRRRDGAAVPGHRLQRGRQRRG